jgi:hypothetical protein
MRIATIGWVVFILGMVASTACKAESEIQLYRIQRRNGQICEWFIPTKRFKQTPEWRPGKAQPPVPLTKALALAEKWIIKEKGGGKGTEAGDILSITIATPGSDERYLFHYYYKIEYSGSRPFDYMACIVLMDGTVLEPRRRYSSEIEK